MYPHPLPLPLVYIRKPHKENIQIEELRGEILWFIARIFQTVRIKREYSMAGGAWGSVVVKALQY
jgi:hypothetical protein